MSSGTLPTVWKTVTLNEVAAPVPNAIVDGPFGSNLKLDDYVTEGVPVLQGKNITDDAFRWFDVRFISKRKADELKRSSVRVGDILIVKIGSIGYSAVVDDLNGFDHAIIPANLAKVTPDLTKVDLRYLHRWLTSTTAKQYFMRVASKTAQPALSLVKIKGLQVPLPPLPEQRRIAEILDKADALRAKRRAVLAQLDTLTQSIFLDMFGDPVAHRWPMSTVAEMAAATEGAIRTGPFGSQLLHSEFTDDGIAVLGIDNVVENAFRWGQRRFISQAKYRQLTRYTVRPGDVLITIMGTCGRCAIVPDGVPTAINTKHLCCITLNRRKCLPAFLHAYFLRHPIARRYLAQKAKGAIMEGLNMGIIRQMPIPLAPIELQEAFAARLAALSDLGRKVQRSESELSAVFASLQHRAFRGELAVEIPPLPAAP